jgi:hypothetical protein
MKQHTKRITAAVTPDIAATYEKLATAGGRTLSSIVSDVLTSRAGECLYFLRWLGQQPAAASERALAAAAVGHIARSSLIDAVRTLDPKYRTPSEQALDRRAVAEAALSILEDLEVTGRRIDDSTEVLEGARTAAAAKGASRWREDGFFIHLPDQVEKVGE